MLKLSDPDRGLLGQTYVLRFRLKFGTIKTVGISAELRGMDWRSYREVAERWKKGKMKNLVLVISGLLLVTGVQAAVLEWDGTQWPNGSLTESYTIGGVDVTITFEGDTDALISGRAAVYGGALLCRRFKLA